ncbi:unnamed protein product [Heterobilharzia americana]|nr:unnamed protein product [Heterobilharzia americana]
MARENVLAFKPTAKINAYHKSIFSSTFDSAFFGSFTVVFSALDNSAARKHVNRMCVSAKVPLIESGTAGYLGQVDPLIPGIRTNESSNEIVTYRTGCYECQPRDLGQRHYPACTIRNTPSEPIHCVVWAKYLFNQLFGQPDVDDEDVSPDFSDPHLHNHDNHNQINEEEALTINNLTNTINTTINNLDSLNTSNSIKSNQLTLREWFRLLWSNGKICQSNTPNNEITSIGATSSLAWRLFHHDIVTLISMRDLWIDRKDRREPSPLDKSVMKDAMDQNSMLSRDALDSSSFGELRDQRKLPMSGWLHIFLNSVEKLQKQVENADGDKFLVWDKDDPEAMDFVASAAVIRSQLFHLPGADQLTRFTIKSLAGNIIPAVASTNAIVAGLMVLQARHILSKHFERVRAVYIHRQPTGRRGNRRFVVPIEPTPPNPSCLVCSDKVKNSQLCLICSPETLTLRVLRDRILIRYLGMLAPDVELSDRGIILISSEEGETDEDTLNKTLADFKVSQGSCLQCDDFRQDFNLRLIISCISTELANALPINSSSQENGNQLRNHFDNDEQLEQWRIIGNIDSIVMNMKDVGGNADQLSSIHDETNINGNNMHKAKLHSILSTHNNDNTELKRIEEEIIIDESTKKFSSKIIEGSIKRKSYDTISDDEFIEIKLKKPKLDTIIDQHYASSSSSSSAVGIGAGAGAPTAPSPPVIVPLIDDDEDDDLILIEDE